MNVAKHESTHAPTRLETALSSEPLPAAPPASARTERNVFVFLAVFLAPILAIAGVGTLGLSIWVWQMIFGPPG